MPLLDFPSSRCCSSASSTSYVGRWVRSN